jgi:methionyl-tRNA formyltransferase
LSELGAILLSESITAIEEGKASYQEQEEKEATYAPPIKKEDRRINWNLPCREIHNKIRALAYHIGAYTFLPTPSPEPLRLIFWQSAIINEEEEKTPGVIIEVNKERKSLFLSTQRGILEVKELQPAGKRKMSGYDFFLGYQRYIQPNKTKLS